MDIAEFRRKIEARNCIMTEDIVYASILDEEIAPIARPDNLTRPKFRTVTTEGLGIRIIQERNYQRHPEPEDVLRRIKEDGLDILYLSELIELLDSKRRRRGGFFNVIVINEKLSPMLFHLDFRTERADYFPGKRLLSLEIGIPKTLVFSSPIIVAQRIS